MGSRCVAPLDDDDEGLICTREATTERLVEGVVCALCDTHARELDEDEAEEAIEKKRSMN